MSLPWSHPAVLNPRLLDWESSALITIIIGKTHVKCKCPVFIHIKQTIGFEPSTPGLGIQCPNHYDNW